LVNKPLDKELDPDPHWDLGLDTQLENMLDPDPHKINVDPQPWVTKHYFKSVKRWNLDPDSKLKQL
jgi:hypothetical protein